MPEAVGVRADDGREVAAVVVDVDQDVRDSRLAGLLDAVRVQIVPGGIAQRHVQQLVVEHQAAADQVEAAEGGIRRGIGREIYGILHVHPQRAVRGRVVPHQRIAVEQVVGPQPQRLPVQEDARQGLHGNVGRGMLAIAVLGIAPQDDGLERQARRAPLRFQHAHRGAERRGLAVAVHPGDHRDLEPVVAAAVHHQEPALFDVAVHRQAVGEQIVDALDVVVVPVAVADVGEHVVRAAIDGPAAQRLFHRRRVVRLQEDVRSRERLLLIEHDVVDPLDRGVGGARDVDLAGQGNAVEGPPAGAHFPEKHLVRSALVETDVVHGARRESRAAPAGRGIVVVRVHHGLVCHRDVRDRLHLRLRRNGCPRPSRGGQQPTPAPKAVKPRKSQDPGRPGPPHGKKRKPKRTSPW